MIHFLTCSKDVDERTEKKKKASWLFTIERTFLFFSISRGVKDPCGWFHSIGKFSGCKRTIEEGGREGKKIRRIVKVGRSFFQGVLEEVTSCLWPTINEQIVYSFLWAVIVISPCTIVRWKRWSRVSYGTYSRRQKFLLRSAWNLTLSAVSLAVSVSIKIVASRARARNNLDALVELENWTFLLYCVFYRLPL